MLNYKHFIICLTALSLFTCERPEFPRLPKDYPVLLTQEAIDVNPGGATLSAKISLPEGETATRFGFTIQGSGGTFDIDLTSWKSLNDFSYRLTTNQEEGQEIFYNAYLETNNYKLTGASLSYISKGKSDAEIIDYFPKTITALSEITIIGRNFHTSQTRLVVESDPGIGRPNQPISFPSSIRKGGVDTIRVKLSPIILDVTNSDLTFVSDDVEIPLDVDLLVPSITNIDKTSGFIRETEFTLTIDNFDLLERSGSTSRIRLHNESRDIESDGVITATTNNTITFRSDQDLLEGSWKVQFIPNLIYKAEIGPVNILARWKRIAGYPDRTDRVEGNVKLVGDKLYSFGAFDEEWVFDFNTKLWEKTGARVLTNGLRGSFVIGDHIYFGYSNANTFYRHNTITKEGFELRRPNLGEISNNPSIVLDGKFHIFFGDRQELKTHIIYDPATDSWTKNHTEVSGHDINMKNSHYVAKDGLIYFLPRENVENYPSIYSLDLKTTPPTVSLISDQGVEGFDRIGGRIHHNSEGLIMTNRYSYPISLFYSFQTNTWTQLGRTPGRSFDGAVTYNGDAYAILDSFSGSSGVYIFRKTPE